ncbi:MAG: twin-arginine translocase TatA/TatE family subunit [Candidatus Aenigmarchaeota archaeon]|nr:twin-arginine translocase TatA/TatE family subunit [Candidatus Aenigmarchaeota archaeon]
MIGLPEVLIILVIVLLLLGPKKLPKLARSIGEAVKEYKKGTGEVQKKKRAAKNPAG